MGMEQISVLTPGSLDQPSVSFCYSDSPLDPTRTRGSWLPLTAQVPSCLSLLTCEVGILFGESRGLT